MNFLMNFVYILSNLPYPPTANVARCRAKIADLGLACVHNPPKIRCPCIAGTLPRAV